jgi:replicative DNA helicase
VIDGYDVTPPHDIDCEQRVLSCVLQAKAAAQWAATNLRVDDFYTEPHQGIFQAMLDAWQRHGAADLTLTANSLRGRGLLEQCGGAEYLMALLVEEMEAVTAERGPVKVQRYGAALRDMARSRRLLKAGWEILRVVNDNPGDADRIAEVAQRGVTQAIEAGSLATRVQAVADCAADVEAWLEAERAQPAGVYGMRLGIGSIDRHLGGLHQQRLVLVKGESKAGKTTLAAQAVWATVTAPDVQGPVLAFLLEGGTRPFLRRFIAWEAQVPRHLMGPGGRQRSTPEQTERIRAAYKRLPDLNLYCHDQVRDIGGIEAEVRNAAMRGPIAGVLVDYAQLVQVQGSRAQNDEGRYRDIAERLQVLANEVNAPIILPSQVTVQQTGEVTEKGARAFGDNCTLSLHIMRGEHGEAKYERMRSPILRVVCDASRDDEPFSPVRLRGDFASNRVDSEEEAEYTEAMDHEHGGAAGAGRERDWTAVRDRDGSRVG